MAKEDYIPVAADDWYQRRRQDDEGEFFRRVSNQSPRKNAGTSTRQGIYAFTADGQLLAFRNHRDPAVMRQVLQQALLEWRKLPLQKRQPGAIKVGEPGKVDKTYDRKPPKGGLIVNVYTRILDKGENGELKPGTCEYTGGDRAARDHLWLTEAEWKSLISAKAKKGDTFRLPARLAYRIGRFHLVDNTRGEPPQWSPKEVRKANVKLTVTDVGADRVKLRLEGDYLLTTDADPAKADRGYDVRLRGEIHYYTGKKQIDRFDVVAVGDHWGQGPFTRGARPGRTPLGIAFELARGDSPADQVAPQGSRYLPGYMNAEQ
jgi:hypothetical protein